MLLLAAPWLGLALIGLLLVAIIYPLATYLRDPKHLRRFPSPSPIAALTPLWQMYHNFHGRKFLAVDAAHRQLGPVVRLAPHHVSFSNPRAYRDIYGHGTPIDKDVFYDLQGGSNPNMAEATDRAVHRQKRRNLAHVFAARQITAMEPRVMEVVAKLVRAVGVKAKGGRIAETDRFPVTKDGVFDLRPWLNMFSYDAITNVFWSQTYGFLDRGDDDCIAAGADGSRESVHAMHSFHGMTAFSVLLGHLSPFWFCVIKDNLLSWTVGGKCGRRFAGMARHLATQRLRNPPSEPDLFSNLPTEASEKQPEPMTADDVLAESGVFLNAGNDTTQSSLTATMYELARNPTRQQRLRDELRAHLRSGAGDDTEKEGCIASYESLQHVAYLRAVIDESFRLHPPVATGPPRLTMKPCVIDGEAIPAGVTVSAQIWSIGRREDLFREATSWRPERWLADSKGFDDEQRANLEYVQPFSQGPRACIGRNLAYMELSICIAALVLAYEWELPGGEGQLLRFHERFNCNPVELPIRARSLL